MAENYLHVKRDSSSNCIFLWNIPLPLRNFVECYLNRPFSSLTKAIRLYDAANFGMNGSKEYEQEIIIESHQREWTVNKLKNNRNYYAEVGIKLSTHHFFPILRSNITTTGLQESDYERILSQSVMSQAWSGFVSTYTYYKSNRSDRDHVLGYEPTQTVEWLNIVSGAIDNTRVTLGKKEKRKILILSWEYPPHLVGGLSRHVHGLAEGLHSMGYEVHVITSNRDQAVQEENVHGIQIYRVTPLNEEDQDFLSWIGGLNLAVLNKALEIDEIHRFHFIHAHDWLVGASSIVLRETLRIPLIVTIHATEFGRNNGIHNELQKFIHKKEQQLISKADTVIVCSEYMKREINQVFHISKDKNIHIIPNGTAGVIPLENASKVLVGMPIQKNKHLIFSIGRIVKEKGFETIIDAAKKMRGKLLNIYFIIAGKGPLLEEYRRMVEGLHLQNHIFFVGYVTEKQRAALLNHCSIAVFPSLYEPFGIVALEAMLAGKPTIISNTGGLKGLVQHKKSGMLMSPGCSECLIEQIMYLLENESHADKIGRSAKERVETMFSWERIANQTISVYEARLIQI